MDLSPITLAAAMPLAPREACITWAPAMDAGAKEFGIDTANKLAGWLASWANETGQLTKFDEAGSDPSYFNTPSPYISGLFAYAPSAATLDEWKHLGRHEFEVRFFDAVYGPMMGNNGQGYKYRGMGCGITGRANYAEIGDGIGVDLENNPELLRDDPLISARAFAWFCRRWKVLDDFADGTEAGAFRGLKRMNSGLKDDVFRTHHLRRWYEVRLGLGIDDDGRRAMRMTQAGLLIAGYDVGARDGWSGPRTRAALHAFQDARGLPDEAAAVAALGMAA